MSIIVFIEFGISVVRQIVQGLIGFTRYIYKAFLFVKLTSVLNKWPEDIKVPMVSTAINKE